PARDGSTSRLCEAAGSTSPTRHRTSAAPARGSRTASKSSPSRFTRRSSATPSPWMRWRGCEPALESVTRGLGGVDPYSRQRVEFGDSAVEVIHPAPVLEFGDDGVLNVAEHRGIHRLLALVLALPNEVGELVDVFTQIHVFPPRPPWPSKYKRLSALVTVGSALLVRTSNSDFLQVRRICCEGIPAVRRKRSSNRRERRPEHARRRAVRGGKTACG